MKTRYLLVIFLAIFIISSVSIVLATISLNKIEDRLSEFRSMISLTSKSLEMIDQGLKLEEELKLSYCNNIENMIDDDIILSYIIDEDFALLSAESTISEYKNSFKLIDSKIMFYIYGERSVLLYFRSIIVKLKKISIFTLISSILLSFISLRFIQDSQKN